MKAKEKTVKCTLHIVAKFTDVEVPANAMKSQQDLANFFNEAVRVANEDHEFTIEPGEDDVTCVVHDKQGKDVMTIRQKYEVSKAGKAGRV
ncbi:MAG: hypothetical protein K8T91_25790 [Planctomycetes bacterium]|nr:hypothetical protein [Planctomycetota bacterium]